MKGLIRGASLGLGLAAIFLLILGAVPLYRLGIQHAAAPFTPDDVRGALFFLIGCTAAGAVIGVSWHVVKSRLARGAVCAAAGAIALLLIAEGPRSGLPSMSAGDIAFYSVVGALFGLALSGAIPLSWRSDRPLPAPSVLSPEAIAELVTVARHQSPEELRELVGALRAAGMEVPPELAEIMPRQEISAP